MEVRVQTGNGRIRLELIPQIDDNDKSGHRSGCGEAEPHEAFAKWPTFFGNISDAMQRWVVEELFGLVD